MVHGMPATNGPFLGFVTMGSADGQVNPALKYPGPFVGQAANMIGYALDTLNISFLNTEAPLAVKGKVVVSIFY